MSLGTPQLVYLCECATEAAREGGRLVAASRPTAIEHKDSGHNPASQIVTDVDRLAQDRILAILTPSIERFALGVLTEESEDDGQRLHSEYFWCIDPLDGTLPFVEAVPGYAVSLALVSRQGDPVVGVVCDPVQDTIYAAIRGQGITRNGLHWHPDLARASSTLSVFADRSIQSQPGYEQLGARLCELASAVGLEAVDMRIGAGAVMNACQVLTSAPACYFKQPRPLKGGGSLWDFAATACLFAEAGAVATDLGGHPLDLNRADSTFMNHRGVLFATDEALAREIRTRFAP